MRRPHGCFRETQHIPSPAVAHHSRNHKVVQTTSNEAAIPEFSPGLEADRWMCSQCAQFSRRPWGRGRVLEPGLAGDSSAGHQALRSSAARHGKCVGSSRSPASRARGSPGRRAACGARWLWHCCLCHRNGTARADQMCIYCISKLAAFKLVRSFFISDSSQKYILVKAEEILQGADVHSVNTNCSSCRVLTLGLRDGSE
jgi:hypothetical protein